MSAISELPKILKAGIKKHNVSGATVAIYRNGRVTQAAAGLLNIDTKVSATTESVFQIGSITKVFTATLIMQLAEEGRMLPGYVQREFEDYLKCGRLEHGFLRVRCENCHEERLVAFSCTSSRRFRRTAWILPELWNTSNVWAQIFVVGGCMSRSH